MTIDHVLATEMKKISGCDAAALISMTTGMILSHAGAMPEEPIRGMLGGAARDMIAGPNVLMIEDEFAKMKGGPSSAANEYGHAVTQVFFNVGRRWHFLQRIPGRADLLLALSCASPNFALVLAQLPTFARVVSGTQI